MVSKERKAKISWQCRRGLLELDIIFEHILDCHLENMTEEQLSAFEKLLTHQDSYLYSWLLGFEIPEDKETQKSVKFIMSRYQSKQF